MNPFSVFFFQGKKIVSIEPTKTRAIFFFRSEKNRKERKERGQDGEKYFAIEHNTSKEESLKFMRKDNDRSMVKPMLSVVC